MFIANERLEPKEKPIKEFSFPFQGQNLHPCIGLMYWFRWDKWIFDIREIRKIYGIKSEKMTDWKALSSASFCQTMRELVRLIGDENFIDVMKRAKKAMIPLNLCNDNDEHSDVPF